MRALVLLIIISFAANGQRVQNFSLYPTNSSVVIKFSVAPGPSCSGFTILHSTDSLVYYEAGSDPGICGVSTEPEEKSFTHTAPVFNKVNFYKVRLEPYVEISSAKSTFVSAASGGQNMMLFPNPFYQSTSDLLRLKFFTVSNVQLTGNIYNQAGTKIRDLDFTVLSGEASVSLAGIENGFYFLRLSDGSKTFRSKFVILK